jgi:hypothetical protein
MQHGPHRSVKRRPANEGNKERVKELENPKLREMHGWLAEAATEEGKPGTLLGHLRSHVKNACRVYTYQGYMDSRARHV